MPTVPKRVSARISSELRRYQKVLALARDRDVNESDTVVIIGDFLHDVLGFEKYSEITTEFSIRGTYCDLAVKTGTKIHYLLEAKAIGVSLKERHLRQATGYAATHGVDWVVLTNGIRWLVYRMHFDKPVRSDLAFSLDLLSVSPRDKEALEQLYLISREGIKKSAIQEYQEHKDACNPFLVGAVLLSDPVLRTLRRELRRITPDTRVDESELRAVLRDEVLKREVVDGEDARAASGRARRAAGRALKRRARVTKDDASSLTTTPSSEKLIAP